MAKPLDGAGSDQLTAQLSRLWECSSFYRALWTSVGFDRSPEAADLTSLPPVTKQDLRAAQSSGEFLGDYRVCDVNDISFVCATSGTSGAPTYFGLTGEDMEDWIRIFQRGFKLAGLESGQRVLHAFAMSRGYAGGVPMIEALQGMDCIAYGFGAEAGSTRLCDALDRLKPDVLYAAPSLVRHLARRYEEETARRAADTTISLILTGGEPGAGDPQSRARIAESWGATVRELAGGSDICPLMWAECDAENGLHFVAEGSVIFELFDLDSGIPIGIDVPTVGELVYTHTRRQASPLVRMRHADAVSFDPTPCSCGSTAPRIKFIGRTDDMLIVRGVKIFPSAVQAVVSEFQPHLTGAMTLDAASAEEGILHVYCEIREQRGPTATDEATTIAERVQSRVRDVLGVRTVCSLVPAGSLIREGAAKAPAVNSRSEAGLRSGND